MNSTIKYNQMGLQSRHYQPEPPDPNDEILQTLNIFILTVVWVDQTHMKKNDQANSKSLLNQVLYPDQDYKFNC